MFMRLQKVDIILERRSVAMNWRIIPVLIFTMLMGIAVTCPDVLQAAPGKAVDVVVICNDSVQTGALKKDIVQDMFLGRKTRWDDGQKIVLATLKEGEAHDSFMGEYVCKTPHQFLNYWKQQVFTGRGKMPGAFATPQELIDFVKKTPGAVGYVPAGAYQNQAKILTIE